MNTQNSPIWYFMPPYVQKSAYKLTLSLFFIQKEAFGPTLQNSCNPAQLFLSCLNLMNLYFMTIIVLHVIDLEHSTDITIILSKQYFVLTMIQLKNYSVLNNFHSLINLYFNFTISSSSIWYVTSVETTPMV